MTDGPAVSRMSMYGVVYAVDLAACRERMAERVFELRKEQPGMGGMQVIADAAGVDRATLRRFFRGERLSVECFQDIVIRGLQMDFQAVARSVQRERDKVAV
jgi:AcrR family transcriptional regulator